MSAPFPEVDAGGWLLSLCHNYSSTTKFDPPSEEKVKCNIYGVSTSMFYGRKQLVVVLQYAALTNQCVNQQ